MNDGVWWGIAGGRRCTLGRLQAQALRRMMPLVVMAALGICGCGGRQKRSPVPTADVIAQLADGQIDPASVKSVTVFMLGTGYNRPKTQSELSQQPSAETKSPDMVRGVAVSLGTQSTEGRDMRYRNHPTSAYVALIRLDLDEGMCAYLTYRVSSYEGQWYTSAIAAGPTQGIHDDVAWEKFKEHTNTELIRSLVGVDPWLPAEAARWLGQGG